MSDILDSSVEERIGPYSVIGAITRGGPLGDVIRVLDQKNNRYLALLLLSPATLQLPGARERLAAEPAILNMEHGNVAGCAEIALDADPPYLAMEYIDGTPLQSLIDSDSLPPLPVINGFLMQACRAFRYAQRHELFHGRLRPEHLMISTQGEIKITEIGLLQTLFGPKAAAAAQEMSRGNPYAAPELAAGAGAGGDFRADVYALGAIFYHILGRSAPPADGAPPPPLTQLSRAVSDGFWQVVKRMLDPNPARRFSSYSELLSALEAGAAAPSAEPEPEAPPQERFDDMVVTSQAPNIAAEPEAEPAPIATTSDRGISRYAGSGRVMVDVLPEKEKSALLPFIIMFTIATIVLLFVGTVVWHKTTEGGARADDGAVTRFLHRTIAGILGGERTLEDDQRRQRTTTREHLGIIESAIREFHQDQRFRPKSLEALVNDGYLEDSVTRDGWGQPTVYNPRDQTIRSIGEDGAADTSDDYVRRNGKYLQQPTPDDIEALEEEF